MRCYNDNSDNHCNGCGNGHCSECDDGHEVVVLMVVTTCNGLIE